MQTGPQHVLACRLRQQVSGKTAAACGSFRLFDLSFDTSLPGVACLLGRNKNTILIPLRYTVQHIEIETQVTHP